jgi:uncharacterized membrane protein YedE/YeeE
VSGYIVGVKKLQKEDQSSSVRWALGLSGASIAFATIATAMLIYGTNTYGVVPPGAEPTAPTWLRALLYFTLAVALGLIMRAWWHLKKSASRRRQSF